MSYAFNLARPNRLVKIVNVKLNGDNPSLKFSSARSEIFVEGSFEVFYRGRSNDTLITYESREKKMENQEFIDVLITDLELLLNEVSDRLDEFNVTFRWCGVEQVDLAHLQNVYDQLTLITSHKKINACSVELAVEDIDQVRIAYTCFDLQTLRHCAFHFVDNQFEDPANAFRRILEIDELKFLDSIEAHFKVENLSIDGLIAIKQVVIDSGRKCKAVIDNSNGNNLQNQELTNIFGDSIEKYQEWIICRCENLKCYIYESRIEIQTKEWKSTPSEKYMRDRRMGSCSEDSEDEDFKLWRESMDIPKRKTSSRPSSYFKEDSSTNGASPKDGLPSTTEDETSELRRKWKTIPERDFNMMLELVITKSLIDSNLVPSTDGESRHSKSSESNINNNMLELEAKRSLLFSKDDSSNVGKMAKRVKFEIMQSLLDPENNSSTDGAGLLDNLPSTSDNRTPRRQRHLEHSMESFDNIMLEAAIKQSLLDLKGDCSADGTRPKPDLSDNKTRTSRERSESSEENSDSIMLKYAIELSLLDSKEDASKIEAITKKLKLELAKLKLRITQSLSDSKDDSLSNEANLQNDLPSTSDSKTPTSRERSESSESNISNILRELENEQSLLDSKNDSSNPEYMMKMLKLDLAKLKLVFFQAVLDAKGNSATDETRPGDVPSLNSEGRTPTSRKRSESSESNIENILLKLAMKESLLESKDDSSTNGASLQKDLPSTSDDRTPTSRKLSENFEENSDNIMLKYAIELSLLDSKKDSTKIEAIPEKLKFELAKLKLGLMKSLSNSKDDPSTNGASLQNDLPSTSDDRTPTSRERSESSESNISNIMRKLEIEQSLLDSKNDSSNPESMMKMLKLDLAKLKLVFFQGVLDAKGNSATDETRPGDVLSLNSEGRNPTSRKRSEISESNIENKMIKLAMKESLLGSEDGSSTDGAMAKMLKMALVQSLLGSDDYSSSDEASTEDDPPSNSDNKTPTSGKRLESYESRIENILLKLAMKESLLESKDDSSTNGASLQKDLPSTSDDRTPTSRKLSENFEENSDNIMLKYAIELSLLDSKKDSSKIEAITKKLTLELAKLKLGITQSLSDSKEDPSTNEASPEDDLPSTSDNRTPTSRERSERSESNIDNKMNKLTIKQSLLDSIDDYSTDRANPEDDLPSTSDEKTPTNRKRSESSESSFDNFMLKLAIKTSLSDLKDDSLTNGASPEVDLLSTSDNKTPTNRKRSQVSESNINNKIVKFATIQSLLNSIDDYSIDGESPEDDLPSTSDKKTPTSRKRSQFSESNINSKRHKFATMQSLLDSKVYSSNNGASPEDDLPSTSQIRSSTMQRRSEIYQQGLSKFHMLLSMAAVHSAFDSRNTSSTEAVPDNDPDSEDSRRHKEHFQNLLLNVNNMIRHSRITQNSSDSKSNCKKEQTGSSHRALTNRLIMSLILQRVGLKTM
ncbi:DUF38 domain-containing protein [Caenorhabditis elegans]|uniref:DUF38 domain-containing protein n=1 Tax=Caenorhabditis elegans TaxID=6239 RepID=G5EF28_CAEEL|nr:F-box A protein [Caenorhabditis elegans]CAN99685.2 F-box A protein [Caenorhabditis elegans]|eukprot:NP_001122855.2 F-box A protein [Caenorhabditis elegans]